MNTFETLADPTRRQIIEALRDGESQVNDIVGRLSIHQSGVSRHLRILLDSGFVEMRPDGPRRLYSLRPEPFVELESWTASFQQLWGARLDRFGKALQRKQTSQTTSQNKEPS